LTRQPGRLRLFDRANRSFIIAALERGRTVVIRPGGRRCGSAGGKEERDDSKFAELDHDPIRLNRIMV
jgi:hypothetical protein